MSIDQSLLNRSASAFAALDFATENTRIAEIQAETARVEEAISQAEARCTEIARDLADWRGPDARAVADGLLAGVAPMTAAKMGPDRATMEAERTALRSAIGDLRKRLELSHDQIANQQDAATRRVVELSQPLIAAIMDDARQAAERIVDAFAALSAINLSAKTGTDEFYRLRRAVERLLGNNNILPFRRDIDVPTDLVAALDKLRDKAPAFPLRLSSKVPAP